MKKIEIFCIVLIFSVSIFESAVWDAENDDSDSEFIYLLKDGMKYWYPFKKLIEENKDYITQKRPDPDLKPVVSDFGRRAGETMTKTIDGVDYTFCWCPAGEFEMGGESRFYDAKPVHTVKLTRGFWMLQTEVTQEMWKSVMGENPSNFTGDKLPVENVSWDDCDEFCQKLRAKGLNVQLPTEAQWEYACRAGTTGDYAGNMEEMTWYRANSGSKTHEVGLMKPNNWGLYDMHGNVWEWCADRYGLYPSDMQINPRGPDTEGSDCVLRGGSWFSDAGHCRSVYRDSLSPDYRAYRLGLRLVWAPSPE